MADSSVSSEFDMLSTDIGEKKSAEEQECPKDGISSVASSIAESADQQDLQYNQRWTFSSQYEGEVHDQFKMLEKQIKLLEENNVFLREKAHKQEEEKLSWFKMQLNEYLAETEEAKQNLCLATAEMVEWRDKFYARAALHSKELEAQAALHREEMCNLRKKLEAAEQSAALDLADTKLEDDLRKAQEYLAEAKRKLHELVVETVRAGKEIDDGKELGEIVLRLTNKYEEEIYNLERVVAVLCKESE